MSLILRQRGLNFAPGEEWSYSNSGYVLLTDLVAHTSGRSFPDFTRKRLFEPLGMKTTTSPSDLRDVIKNPEKTAWWSTLKARQARVRKFGRSIATPFRSAA